MFLVHISALFMALFLSEIHILLELNLNESINRLYSYFMKFVTVVSQGDEIKLFSSS